MNIIFAILLMVLALLQLPAIKRKDEEWKLNIIVLIACVIFAVVSLIFL